MQKSGQAVRPQGGRYESLSCASRARSRCWDYQRIAGELAGIGISATTVRKAPPDAGSGPSGERAGPTWREFLRSQDASTLACDFFTVDMVGMRRLYVLFFIGLKSRREHLVCCAENLNGAWVRGRIATSLVANRETVAATVPDPRPRQQAHRSVR
jgi:hypothetical protein